MKVLHLPNAIAGMPWSLAQGEKKLGLESKVLVKTASRYEYGNDINLHWENKGILGMFFSSIATFMKYRSKYDVYHFNYGSTLIDFRGIGLINADLPFYSKGKKIIFTYNGCDARQKYKTIQRTDISPCHNDNCYGGVCNARRMDRRKEKAIEKVSKFADHIFAVNPDLLYFLPPDKSTFLPYSISGWDEIKEQGFKPGKKIKLVHAPTDRAAKGSDYIINAVEKLKKKHNIELMIVENMTHEAALEVYKNADIVLDQLLAGWYGGFAVEVMKMGKPVVSFIREEDLKFIPDEMAMDLKATVINATPYNVEEVLDRHLQSTSILKEKSEACIEYVNKWHDPLYVAGITKAVYEK